MASKNSERKLIPSLLISSFSSVSALLFSHPFEVVKSRMQVLSADQKVYGSLFGALFKIAKEEGFSGIYQGLIPAMGFQFVMNGIRLGTYPIIKQKLNAYPQQKFYYTKAMIASSLAGILSVIFAAPAFSIKVRMQIQALTGGKSLGVFGHIKNMYKEAGILGLWKGTNAQFIRMIAGSSSQLVAYDQANEFLKKNVPSVQGKLKQIIASTYSAFILSIAMHPFDLAVSKINQNAQNNAFKPNLFKVLSEQIQKEGFLSVFKGFNAACFRNIPYTIFSLVFWEYYSEIASTYGY